MRRFLYAFVAAAFCLIPALPAAAKLLSDSDQALYRDAFADMRTGNWPAAARRAHEARNPILAKVVHFYDLTRRGGGASFSDITTFATANPDWPGQTTLRERAEEAIASATDQDVEKWFEQIPPVSPFGKLRQADIWRAHGAADRALAQIRQTWIDGEFNAFEEKLVLQRYGGDLRPADHIKRLDRLLWDERFDDAKRLLTRVSAAERSLAEARMALAKMDAGADRLVQRVPRELQNDPGLLFERMRWRRRKENYDAAIDILEHPPQDLVRPQAWWSERDILARHALAAGDISVAYRLASRHGMAGGPNYLEAEFLAGWIALRFLREPDVAYDHFVNLYGQAVRPVSQARGAYWAGRAAADRGYATLATAWYDSAARNLTTYYGQLAAAKIGGDGKAAILEEPQPTKGDTAQFDRRDLVVIVRALDEANAADFAKPFVLHLADTAQSPAEYVLIARLAESIGQADLAVATAKRASYAGVTLLAEGYPVVDIPPGSTVESPLVLAMTRQESAFDAHALSPAGARGMMQLLPATAKIVAKSLALPFSDRRLGTDARYNLTLGRGYLERLLDNFSGSYVLAIASYNAGPARIHQWVHDLGDPRAKDIDVIDWVESIPYFETRSYVQRVLENLQVYRLKLGDHALAFSLSTDLKR